MKRSIVDVIAVVLILMVSAACAGRTAASPANTDMPQEGSTSVIFARAMMAHHAQAVEMSLNMRDRTGDAELRVLMLDIILTQQNQIGQMMGWLAVWGIPFAAPATDATKPAMSGMDHGAGDSPMPGMATQKDVNALTTLSLAEAEKSFLTLMIRHHQGGVTMAQEVLTKTTRPEVQRLAEAIVRSQQNEIETMAEMLKGRQ